MIWISVSALAFADTYESEPVDPPAWGFNLPHLPPNPNADQTEGFFEQAVGSYAHGSLIDATAFSDHGNGFMKVFRNRHRDWGTSDIRDVIELVAEGMTHTFPGSEQLQIADIASENGGPVGLHASHQNGLDVDVIYLRRNHMEQDPDLPDFAESFVHGSKISWNFDLERNWSLIRDLYATARVDRIFVDRAVKKALCNYGLTEKDPTERAEVLRILRPWPSHDTHMHVRITCPERSPRCISQLPIPPGDGCSEL